MAQIIGLIKRALNRKDQAAFYELIGLSSREHQHGGPVHDEVGSVSSKFVVEIYLATQRFITDALMVEVDDLKSVLHALEAFGIKPHHVVSEGRSVYVKDPDGCDVMLIQI